MVVVVVVVPYTRLLPPPSPPTQTHSLPHHFVPAQGFGPAPDKNDNCGVSGLCYSNPNKEWPLPPSHCQELDNPGGKASAFWANRSSAYAIGWRNGTCDRGLFNVVNKVKHNYDKYVNVTMWYFGINH